ncbi:hypothetical protein KPL70_014852 [Citrus sinensis]|nr:hypothetical protein KPL70_014852 [Citrus sinensis]
MEALLITQGLGDAFEPEMKEGKGVSSSKTPEEFAEIHRKARSTIILSLGDSVIREVAKDKTVAGLWSKLESLYMTKSLANRLYIKKRMFTLKMAEGASLEEHIDEFNKVCDTLKTIDAALDDEGKALLLISLLPKSYKNLVDALMYGRQTLTLDEVKSALNTRELQTKQGHLENSGSEGLTAKVKTDKKKKKGKSKNKERDLKCFQCHKEGHFKRDCPEKKFKTKDSRNQSGDAVVVEEEGYESAGVCVATKDSQKGKWVMDSGCTFHMCPFRNYFNEYQAIDGGRVMMGNNSICKIIGIGDVSLKLHDGSIRVLRQVRHVPDLKRNLISLGVLDQIGCRIKLESGALSVLNGSNLVMSGTRKNGVYILDGEVISGVADVSIKHTEDKTRLWHLRLGHMSERGLKELAKQGLFGSDKIGNLEFCEDCVLGKSSRGSFKRKVWVYVLKNKDQTFEKFKEWKHMVENQTGKRLKKLRTDNGLEFCNQPFDNFCANEGIARHRTVRMTPQQNGLAERMNKTLTERVRCMLIQSKLPKTLWAEILLTACYLVNLSPSTGINFKTPFEMWSGKTADYGILKAFGCPAYIHVSQGKLAARALRGIFIGYPEGVKGFKIWCTDLKPPKCIVSRDVVFNEGSLMKINHEPDLETENSRLTEKLEFEVEPSTSRNTTEAVESDSVPEIIDDTQAPQDQSSSQEQVREYQLTRDRKKRQIKPTRKYGYADLIGFALAAAKDIDDEEPKNFKEATQSLFKEEWQRGMDDEMASLYKNNTWEMVKKPGNRRVVGCKWIFKIKEGTDGSEPRRFKARLVAKGYTQKEGIDFKEVFSPVVRHASIRVILAITAVQDMELDQLDVKTSFLHGRLEEEILMSQPEGYEFPGKEDHVCQLKKSLYGLKQSPRQWYLRFDEFMQLHEFIKCSYDCCVYYKTIKDGLYIYLLLYVDDMLVACKDREEIDKLKVLLNSEFEMKDLGYARKILGMEIRRNRSKGIMFLSQEKYLRKVLETFDMSKAKPVQLPLASHFRLSNLQCLQTEAEKQDMASVPYANAVGCLMYAMVLTRPDIAHAVSVVSRYMAQPGEDHWKAVKWILRYLNGTVNWGLMYGKTEASDEATLQSVVALSTTEAEYTATTEAVKEALWLKGLVTELGLNQKSVLVYCDSSSAIHLSKNPAHHEKTKHIDIKLHFIRNEVSRGAVKMVKIHTDENPADAFTKVIPVAKFRACLDLAGLCSQ